MSEEERARAVARLTENEKAALRRRLAHLTAKEAALELGVSPHAVEKRLKMARAKLGVSSSLAAARLLAAAEGYGEPVPRSADLPSEAATTQTALSKPQASTPATRFAVRLLVGAATMLLFILIAVTPQPQRPIAPATPSLPNRIITLPASDPGPRVGPEPAPERAEDEKMRSAGPDEVTAFVRDSFRTMDKDGSGYIEQAEAPANGVGISKHLAVAQRVRRDTKIDWFTGPRGQAMWVANMDSDRDGRVSEAEYVAWDVKIWRDHVPANWAWRR